jgi:glutathione S-transferase
VSTPIVHGPAYSTYTRTARLALEEKPAAYELNEVHVLGGAHKEPPHLARHPFGVVPAFEHDGMMLYETSAITRYIDRAFPGAKLQPDDLKRLARMDQIIAVIDAYAYPAMITRFVMQRLVAPMIGGQADEAVIAEAMPRIKLCLSEIERTMGDGPFAVGDALSLADLHLAPIFAYLTMTPESATLLEPHGRLRDWWERISARPSMAKTQPKFG